MPSPPFREGAGGRLINLYLDMKKVYVAPQTEALELMVSTALMAASPVGTGNFDMMYGTGGGDGGGMG